MTNLAHDFGSLDAVPAPAIRRDEFGGASKLSLKAERLRILSSVGGGAIQVHSGGDIQVHSGGEIQVHSGEGHIQVHSGGA